MAGVDELHDLLRRRRIGDERDAAEFAVPLAQQAIEILRDERIEVRDAPLARPQQPRSMIDRDERVERKGRMQVADSGHAPCIVVRVAKNPIVQFRWRGECLAPRVLERKFGDARHDDVGARLGVREKNALVRPQRGEAAPRRGGGAGRARERNARDPLFTKLRTLEADRLAKRQEIDDAEQAVAIVRRHELDAVITHRTFDVSGADLVRS